MLINILPSDIFAELSIFTTHSCYISPSRDMTLGASLTFYSLHVEVLCKMKT